MTQPLPLETIASLSALEAAATPGPWGDASAGWGGSIWSGPVAVDDGSGSVTAENTGTFQICEMTSDDYEEPNDGDHESGVAQSEADAALLVAARNALPALLEMAREHVRILSQLQRLYDSGACVKLLDGLVGSLSPDGIESTARHVGWKDPTKAEV